MFKCELATAQATMMCKKKLDVVLLIDGSGSLGETGWKAEKKMAELFISAFEGTGTEAQLSTILYSGPSYWSGVRKCFAGPFDAGHIEKVCKVVIKNQLTSDIASVKSGVEAMTWPAGSTLTSIALMQASSVLSQGREDAHSIVVAITDGRPLSRRATWWAARHVRKKARLVWVAVTRYAPLRMIKRMATRRWQENVIVVPDFSSLADAAPDHVTHIVANICPMELV